MQQLVSWLAKSRLIRRIAQIVRAHRLVNAWLRRFPLVRRLSASGIVYRATRVESIPLAEEMFTRGALYDASLLPAGFTTFIDLGCNVGYFTCWLLHVAAGRKLKGLMVDANAEAVAEARWHGQANECPDIHGFHGIVGEGMPGETADFYLYESNICSTSHKPDLQEAHLKGEWTHTRVPVVNVEALWTRHFGSERCHVLKIDIEGSELTFLKAERTFLRLVDSILVEWHKWRVTLEEIQTFLTAEGFKHVRTLDENIEMGTAYFARA